MSQQGNLLLIKSTISNASVPVALNKKLITTHDTSSFTSSSSLGHWPHLIERLCTMRNVATFRTRSKPSTQCQRRSSRATWLAWQIQKTAKLRLLKEKRPTYECTLASLSKTYSNGQFSCPLSLVTLNRLWRSKRTSANKTISCTSQNHTLSSPCSSTHWVNFNLKSLKHLISQFKQR